MESNYKFYFVYLLPYECLIDFYKFRSMFIADYMALCWIPYISSGHYTLTAMKSSFIYETLSSIIWACVGCLRYHQGITLLQL